MSELTRGYIAAAVAGGLLACSCGKSLNDQECTALLDRYTELLARAQDSKIPAHRISELQEKARNLAQTEPTYEFADCSRRVSRRNFDCAMQAPTVDELERCMIF